MSSLLSSKSNTLKFSDMRTPSFRICAVPHGASRDVVYPSDMGSHATRWGRRLEGFGLGNLRRHPKRRVREELKVPDVLVDFITSLDGFGAADGWPGWWGLEGPEYLTWLGES